MTATRILLYVAESAAVVGNKSGAKCRSDFDACFSEEEPFVSCCSIRDAASFKIAVLTTKHSSARSTRSVRPSWKTPLFVVGQTSKPMTDHMAVPIKFATRSFVANLVAAGMVGSVGPTELVTTTTTAKLTQTGRSDGDTERRTVTANSSKTSQAPSIAAAAALYGARSVAAAGDHRDATVTVVLEEAS